MSEDTTRRLEELEELAREQIAEIASLQFMVRALFMALPPEGRVTAKESFRLMLADHVDRLSEGGFELSVAPDPLRELRERVLRAASAYERFFQG